MLPTEIWINCGHTWCNIFKEYCRNNQICASCNEHVCNLKDHIAEFPEQCFFYCENVLKKLKELADKGSTIIPNIASSSHVQAGVIGVTAVLGLLCVVLFIAFCTEWKKNRKLKGNLKKRQENDDYTKLNIEDNNDEDNNIIRRKTDKDDNNVHDDNNSKDVHIRENDSAFSSAASMDTRISREERQAGRETMRYVKETFSPQNDREENLNKLVINGYSVT